MANEEEGGKDWFKSKQRNPWWPERGYQGYEEG